MSDVDNLPKSKPDADSVGVQHHQSPSASIPINHVNPFPNADTKTTGRAIFVLIEWRSLYNGVKDGSILLRDTFDDMKKIFQGLSIISENVRTSSLQHDTTLCLAHNALTTFR